jgi:hypothetical protein
MKFFRWEKLIKETSMLMRKFTVTISGIDEIESKVELEGGRQQILKIENYNERDSKIRGEKLLNAVEPDFKTTVKTLTFSVVHLSQNSIDLVLNGFSCLSKLTFHNTYYNDDAESSILNLENLKTLEMIQSDAKILNLIKDATNIQTLKIDMIRPFSESITTFVARCDGLKTLILRNNAKLAMCAANEHPFKLKRLSVDNLFDPKLSMEEVIKFLRHQKATLREMEVKNAPRDLVLRCILADLFLEKLQLGISGLQTTLNYFHVIKKNNYLKTLVMRGSVKQMDVVKGIIEQYPSEFENKNIQKVSFNFYLSLFRFENCHVL